MDDEWERALDQPSPVLKSYSYSCADHGTRCETARRIAKELPEAYDVLPPDILVGFITVQDDALSVIRKNLDWARALPYRAYAVEDAAISSATPTGRAEYEALCPAGPVGTMPAEGCAVILERLGAIPARKFCRNISDEEMIRQSVYNRQAAHLWNRVLSHRHQRNLRRAVVIIDMRGFGLFHVGSAFQRKLSVSIKTLLPVFPECSHGFFMINAPAILRAAWEVAKQSGLLDAETVAKTHILGGPSQYEPALKRLGIVIDNNLSLAKSKPSWSQAMQQLVAEREREGEQQQQQAEATRNTEGAPSVVDGDDRTPSGGIAPPPFLTAAEAEIYAAGLAARAGGCHDGQKNAEAVPSPAALATAAEGELVEAMTTVDDPSCSTTKSSANSTATSAPATPSPPLASTKPPVASFGAALLEPSAGTERSKTPSPNETSASLDDSSSPQGARDERHEEGETHRRWPMEVAAAVVVLAAAVALGSSGSISMFWKSARL